MKNVGNLSSYYSNMFFLLLILLLKWKMGKTAKDEEQGK
jgi:hypothetical protein